MHSRALRITVLLFQALWLNVIVPGHQRGSVGLPGWDCADCQAQASIRIDHSCCALHASNPDAPPVHGDPVQHCAICFFAAHLSLPPALDVNHGRLFFTETLPAPAVESIAGRTFHATYDGRGPPEFCA